jgi:hypothetical protein
VVRACGLYTIEVGRKIEAQGQPEQKYETILEKEQKQKRAGVVA